MVNEPLIVVLQRANDAAKTRAARVRHGHVHTANCTIESCGLVRFVCPTQWCVRVLDDKKRTACEGHLVPSRQILVESSLHRRGLA